MSPDLAELSGVNASAALARLRATDPVAWVPFIDGWLVTSYDLAVEVMRDFQAFTVDDPRFTTGRVVGASMLSLDGEEHRRHRAPFVAPFRPSRVERSYAARIEVLVAGLVDQIRPNGHADLRKSLAGPLSVAVVAETLGLREVDALEVLGWYDEIVTAVTALSAGQEPGEESRRAMTMLAEHVRVGSGPQSILAAARQSLTEPEIVANAAVMMFGGIETTEGMITNAVLHLLDNPATLTQVSLDRSLVGPAVEESLRLEPAAAVVDRYATRDVELGTRRIRAGDLVRVSIAGANRDPRVFPEPDRFDLRRPNVRAQLAFARGPHVCIAMDLARLETRIAVEAVLGLPGLCLVRRDPPTGLIFRKPASLVVRWEPSPA